MITQQTKDIIAATLPAVKENARLITETFYPLMFERYPEVKAYFNQTHQAKGTQRQALANAVVAYASNLDRLEALGDAVSLIVHKHASLNIVPEQYPIVGECLLAAIKEVFGDAASPEVLDAWGAIYQQLADILIGAEEAVYKVNEEKSGGWRGERLFTLTDKVQESDVITSFYLKPTDGGEVADFIPGQYIGIKLTIDGEVVRRNYSLSNIPGKDYYRISVKREPGGLVSNFLHDRLNVGDTVELTAPVGDFILDSSDKPLALVTGGVGVTPALSMLEPALRSGRPVHFIHGALNSATHAFKDYINQLADQYDNLSVTYCYSEPQAGDTCENTGFITEELLSRNISDPARSRFYFIGPKPFMEKVYAASQKLGVAEEDIKFEFFGPLQTLNPSNVNEEETAAA